MKAKFLLCRSAIAKMLAAAIILTLAVAIAGAAYYLTLPTPPPSGTLVVELGVSGATVIIFGPEGTLRGGVTGQNGQVVFKDLQDGDYNMLAKKMGYYTTVGYPMRVSKGITSTINSTRIFSVIADSLPYAITNPSAIIIKQGSTGTIAITVTSYNNFEGEVELTCDGQLNGDIHGVTAAFDPSNVTLAAGGTASSTLTLTVSANTTKGNYILYIMTWDYSPILIQVS